MTQERIEGLTAAVRKLVEYGGKIAPERWMDEGDVIAGKWLVLSEAGDYLRYFDGTDFSLSATWMFSATYLWEPPKPAETANLTAKEAARMLFEKGGEIEGPAIQEDDYGARATYSLEPRDFPFGRQMIRVLPGRKKLRPSMTERWFSDERCWVHREAAE